MDNLWVEWLVRLAGGYLTLGLLFAGPFVLKGVDRIDRQAVGGSWGFRLAVVPGVVAFWPLLLRRWLEGSGPPEESNAHRRRPKKEGDV